MNKKELEKMFDERFSNISRSIEKNYDEDLGDVKDYFFETIIPEVLKSILPGFDFQNDVIPDIKQKAKEQFGIDL